MKEACQVFVVDDNAYVREGLRALFNPHADLAICGEAVDAKSALEKIAAPKPDIAVIDLSLNGNEAEGIDLIKELREKKFNFPILVHSYHNEMSFVQGALSAGAQGYILKQEARKNLINAIRQIVAGQPYLSAGLTNF